MNPLTPKAGQFVNHYCTPETSFWLKQPLAPRLTFLSPGDCRGSLGRGRQGSEGAVGMVAAGH